MSSLYITTPEKWDSITRRWKEIREIINETKLLLIDEIHILNEARGSTLEAVISRMRSTYK